MFGHLRDIVEGLSVWVTEDVEISRSWHWSDCTNDFSVGVFESHVTTELLSFLLILKFFSHFICAFFRNFKLIFELTPIFSCTTYNLYGSLQHKTVHKGMLIRDNFKLRPFVLTRSFYFGSQKYGAYWTGDNQEGFQEL